jgi:hypothetical protein
MLVGIILIFQANLDLAQHAYNDHRICWKDAEVLQIKPNGTYRKCKETAYMVLVVCFAESWTSISSNIFPITEDNSLQIILLLHTLSLKGR